MKKLAILASGSGSNAENIVNHFKADSKVEVTKIFTNKQGAGVIERANRLDIPVEVFHKEQLLNGELLMELQSLQINYIILAGFLLRVPSNLVEAYPNGIINIHPALLPKFGGKGMYGHNVHQAVFENKETESGITVHYVNENYDEGAIIKQEKCRITEKDTPETIEQKVRELEIKYFPTIIEEVIYKKNE